MAKIICLFIDVADVRVDIKCIEKLQLEAAYQLPLYHIYPILFMWISIKIQHQNLASRYKISHTS